MITQSVALYNNTNGVVMIAVFAVVCIALIGFLVSFMVSGGRKDQSTEGK